MVGRIISELLVKLTEVPNTKIYFWKQGKVSRVGLI